MKAETLCDGGDESDAMIEAQLAAGETLVWWGRPELSVWLHSGDWVLIPFSVIFNAVAAAWTWLVAVSYLNSRWPLMGAFAAVGALFFGGAVSLGGRFCTSGI